MPYHIMVGLHAYQRNKSLSLTLTNMRLLGQPTLHVDTGNSNFASDGVS